MSKKKNARWGQRAFIAHSFNPNRNHMPGPGALRASAPILMPPGS